MTSRCHLPILYVGLEYSLTNNLRLAERLYSESLKFYPDDPAVLHELGVINYLNRELVCHKRLYTIEKTSCIRSGIIMLLFSFNVLC